MPVDLAMAMQKTASGKILDELKNARIEREKLALNIDHVHNILKHGAEKARIVAFCNKSRGVGKNRIKILTS